MFIYDNKKTMISKLNIVIKRGRFETNPSFYKSMVAGIYCKSVCKYKKVSVRSLRLQLIQDSGHYVLSIYHMILYEETLYSYLLCICNQCDISYLLF